MSLREINRCHTASDVDDDVSLERLLAEHVKGDQHNAQEINGFDTLIIKSSKKVFGITRHGVL